MYTKHHQSARHRAGVQSVAADQRGGKGARVRTHMCREGGLASRRMRTVLSGAFISGGGGRMRVTGAQWNHLPAGAHSLEVE